MNERHVRAVVRCVTASLTLGLAAAVLVSFLPTIGKDVVGAVLVVADLALLGYLWRATAAEPEQRHPSTARAVYERNRARRQLGG